MSLLLGTEIQQGDEYDAETPIVGTKLGSSCGNGLIRV